MNGSDRPRRSGLPTLGLMLAIGLVLSTLIVAGMIEKIKASGKTLTVKGYAERKVFSDTAAWQAGFVARSPDLVEAYKKLQQDQESVLRYLQQNGLARESILISAVRTSVQHKKNKEGITLNEIEGYVLSQGIEITSTNVALIARLATESSALIKDGIEFNSSPPAYFVSTIDEHKLALLGEATRNAKLRAEQLATSCGRKVGDLEQADQGVFQITPPNSTEVSGYGVYDTSTIEKRIKAVVAAQFSFGK